MTSASPRYFDAEDLFHVLSSPFRVGQISEFENEMARYIGTRHAIGTSFGRAALLAGLMAMKVSGREVILPSFICTVVRHAVILAGATPRFVDIDPNDFTYDMPQLVENISHKTSAILLVHYFGRVARNMDAVLQVAAQNDIALIEDCAHSLGAMHGNRRIGTFGKFAIFSLTKNMVNFGGGVLVTDDDNLHDRARQIVNRVPVSFLSKASQLPKIVAYGMELGVNKLMFDRVKRNPLKYLALALPRSILMVRRTILQGKTLVMQILRFGKRPPSFGEPSQGGPGKRPSIVQPLAMWPVMASLGRSQLRKLDALNRQRCIFINRVSALSSVRIPSTDGTGDVCTHLVLHFHDRDIFETVRTLKQKGLLLRPTWPTHQRLWNYQDTASVRRLRDHVLTYDINPMLTDREVKRFKKLMLDVSA